MARFVSAFWVAEGSGPHTRTPLTLAIEAIEAFYPDDQHPNHTRVITRQGREFLLEVSYDNLSRIIQEITPLSSLLN